jgi:hypothetical protein
MRIYEIMNFIIAVDATVKFSTEIMPTTVQTGFTSLGHGATTARSDFEPTAPDNQFLLPRLRSKVFKQLPLWKSPPLLEKFLLC